MTYRVEKVNELIKREISEIIAREIELPLDSLVTVVQVKTASDLTQTKIYLSIFPITKAAEILKILRQRIGYLQGLLNRRLVMRPLPRINFLIDTTEEEANQVEDIIKKVYPS